MSVASESLVETPVWDLPVRLFHWSFAVCLTVSWLSGQFGERDLHYLSGLAVLGLVLFRVLWGLVGSPTARFSHFLKGPGTAISYLKHTSRSRSPSYSFGHNAAGGLMVVALLMFAGLQALSGLGNTDDVLFDGPLYDDLPEWLTDKMGAVHEPMANLLLALVLLHVAAVAAYRLVKRENLVRAMIVGSAKLPAKVASQSATSGQTRRGPLLRAAICLALASVPPVAIYWLN